MRERRGTGFSLLEMIMVLAIFLIVSGATFAMLNSAQMRYKAEQDFLESFQGSRRGVDQLLRDIHNAGYPPAFNYPRGNMSPNIIDAFGNPVPVWTTPAAAPINLQKRFAIGVAALGSTTGQYDPTCSVPETSPGTFWNVGAPPAGMPNPCNQPDAYNLVLELDQDPENVTAYGAPSVEFVAYSLACGWGGQWSNSFFRHTAAKEDSGWGAGYEFWPWPIYWGTMWDTWYTTPYVSSVTNCDPMPQPAGFPAEAWPGQLPIFNLQCDPQFRRTTAGGANYCEARYVQSISVTLRVASRERDPQTKRYSTVTLQGIARMYNPHQ